MAPVGKDKRPSLDEELVKRWPTPDGVEPALWRRWTYEAREDYLIDHAFERSGDTWVPRADTAGSKTARQVEQAVTTQEGVATVRTQLETVWADRAGLVDPDDVDQETRAGMSDSEWEGLRDEWEHRHSRGPSRAAWMVLTLFLTVLTAAIIAALALDLFGGDDEPAPADPAVAAGEAEAGGEAEAPSDGEGADEAPEAGAAGPDADAITFSSVPDHERYVGAWTDGEVVIELNADGTYELRSADSQTAGSFKVAVVGGADYLELLDPDDPSGLTVTAQVPLALDGATLAYGDRLLGSVPDAAAVELTPAGPPGPFVIDASMVTIAQGGFDFDVHSNQVGDCGTQHVRTDVSGYEVDLLLDLAARTLTGSSAVTYACPDCDPGQTVAAAARFDIASATVDGEGGVWSYSGMAQVDMRLEGATADDRGSCEWGTAGVYDVPFQGTLFTGSQTGSVEMRFDDFNDADLQTEPRWRWSLFLNYRTE